MATVTIPDKICPHCGETRWVEMKYKKKTGNICIQYYYCAKKMSEYAKEYVATSKGRESIRKANRKSKKKQSNELTDYYITNLLYIEFYKVGIPFNRKSLTQEQIQLFRQSLSLQRKLKAINHESKGQTNNN